MDLPRVSDLLRLRARAARLQLLRVTRVSLQQFYHLNKSNAFFNIFIQLKLALGHISFKRSTEDIFFVSSANLLVRVLLGHVEPSGRPETTRPKSTPRSNELFCFQSRWR